MKTTEWWWIWMASRPKTPEENAQKRQKKTPKNARRKRSKTLWKLSHTSAVVHTGWLKPCTWKPATWQWSTCGSSFTSGRCPELVSANSAFPEETERSKKLFDEMLLANVSTHRGAIPSPRLSCSTGWSKLRQFLRPLAAHWTCHWMHSMRHWLLFTSVILYHYYIVLNRVMCVRVFHGVIDCRRLSSWACLGKKTIAAILDLNDGKPWQRRPERVSAAVVAAVVAAAAAAAVAIAVVVIVPSLCWQNHRVHVPEHCHERRVVVRLNARERQEHHCKLVSLCQGALACHLLRPTLMYKPKDLNWDWSPRFLYAAG